MATKILHLQNFDLTWCGRETDSGINVSFDTEFDVRHWRKTICKNCLKASGK